MTAKKQHDKLYIVAGNHAQAQRYAQEQSLKVNDWVFVHGVERLLGLRNIPIALVGTYYERKDWPQLKIYIEYIEYIEARAMNEQHTKGRRDLAIQGKAMKKRNPNDLTGRNNKARKAQIERVEAKLTKRIERIEKLLAIKHKSTPR